MRNLYAQRNNAHGKAMRLGKQQQYALSHFFDDNGAFRKGVARSAWLHRVLDSLYKHGLIERGLTRNFDGPENVMGPHVPKYTLTQFGIEERARLRSSWRIGVDIPPSNPTLRQSAHIEASVREKKLREAGVAMHNSGVMDAREHPAMDAQTVEDEADNNASMMAGAEGMYSDLDASGRVMLRRWLRMTYLAAFYAQRAADARKEVL